MTKLTLVVAAVVFLIFNNIATCFGSDYNGKFETKEGSHCEWQEEVYRENVRVISLECTCMSATGAHISYSCGYFGNPQECEYFDKRGGKERFYHQIANHMKDQEHGCLLSTINASEVTRVCGNSNVLLTKRDLGRARLHNPSHCVKVDEKRQARAKGRDL